MDDQSAETATVRVDLSDDGSIATLSAVGTNGLTIRVTRASLLLLVRDIENLLLKSIANEIRQLNGKTNRISVPISRALPTFEER